MANLAQETRQKYPRSNVIPVWLLVYWRLLKGTAEGDYAKAYQSLGNHLPNGQYCPTAEECAIVLVDHQLM